MNKIKIGDFKTTIEQKEVINIILQSGKITEGDFTKKFETLVKKFLRVKEAIAVSNGTVALQLVAYYLKHKMKKETPVVCVPATTFPATVNAFLLTGYKAILCDIHEDNLCININKLTEEEKEKIDVIVPVSLLGYTPNMDKIMEEAKKYKWIVIEDFAEAFGSVYKGKKIGSIGDFGCSSFFISHVFQGGELGVITTNNEKEAGVLRKMKCHGRTGDPLLFNHDIIGSNYKTNEFCTGLASSQLMDAEEIIKKRQKIAKIYFEGIKNPNLKPMPTNENYSPLGYPIIANTKEYKEKVCKILNESEIETRGMFPCLANQMAYRRQGNVDYLLGKPEKYPISVDMESRGFYIGVHHYILPQEAIKVVEIINKIK